MSLLGREEIVAALASLPGWEHRGNALEKRYDRGDFDGSMHFVNTIAIAANAQNHHPDLTISWNDVTVTLSSHDAGGITGRDLRLAETIDRLAEGPR